MAVYDINTANIWNYLSKSDMNLVKTFNIPYTSQGITVSKDSVEFEKDSYIRYHKSTGVNPLHFRDDADRIVLTLMAPKDEKVKIWVEDFIKEFQDTVFSTKILRDNPYVAPSGKPPLS